MIIMTMPMIKAIINADQSRKDCASIKDSKVMIAPDYCYWGIIPESALFFNNGVKTANPVLIIL